MHVVIAGGSGFIGANLTQVLLKQQHQVTILTHSEVHKVLSRLSKHYVFAKALLDAEFAPNRDITVMPYEDYSGEGDVLINLAGESLGAKAITMRRLHQLEKSRTTVLDDLASQVALPPIFIQASAVALYPNSDLSQDESAPTTGEGEIADLARLVESKAQALNEQFHFKHFYLARFGIVLHRSGGLIKKASFLPPFTVIRGDNTIPFIELNDAIEALLLLCNGAIESGPVNFTSPCAATLKELLRCCYKHSRLPQLPIITGFLRHSDRRIQLLSANQHIEPKVLLQNQFKFKHADISSID